VSAPKKVVVLISGRGSNLEALLSADLPVSVATVISNVPGVTGLAIAAARGISTAVIDHRAYRDRESFEAALAPHIDACGPDLVLLAGFMRVLTSRFVARYGGRMLNIHPSLLPSFPGLHTHRRALEAGVRIHGCTVHFVTPSLDGGPIVIQSAVPVLPGDDEDALAARVLAQEHRIYPQAVRWFCEDRLRLGADGAIRQDGQHGAAGALISPALSLPSSEPSPPLGANAP
jgi:phosphoribosylglycinamide formyltransferase-1